MRLSVAMLSIGLASGIAAAVQGAPIGAYPSGSGPNGPSIGAYPDQLGTPPAGVPGAVESPLHHDETLDYCRSQPGSCNVKQPDNHDLSQHQLDETTAPLREAPPQPPPAAKK
jgi:hypothetical protein